MSKIVLNVCENVTSSLAAWSGYAPIQGAMRDHMEVSFFLAGGAVRDTILNNNTIPKDFDLFIGGHGYPAVISQLKAHGKINKGPFGSPRWYPKHNSTDYADIIPIAKFYNGLWRCSDIKDVLNQFDFTGNAIGIDLRNGEIHDPQNGIRDLSRRMMRAVRFDYPDEAILPGHPITRTTVLWFRILHYAALLDLTIEPVTFQWLEDHKDCNNDLDLFEEYFFKPNSSYLAPLQKKISLP